MGLFRDPVDADIKRKEITWIAIVCLFVLSAWQFLATFLGSATDFSPRSYEEKVLFGGLGAILLCSVLYIATREREQRLINQRLLFDLRSAMSRLNDRLRQLHQLCTASAELVGTLDAEEICRLTVESLARQLKAGECLLSFLHPQQGWLEFKIRGSELIVEKSHAELLLSDFHPVGPEISAPLHVNDSTVGTLMAARAPGEAEFCPEEVSLLVTSANMAAKALENARLHEELRESYLSTLRTLIRLLGVKDNYTASHAQRVGALACRLAEQLNLPEEQIQLLEEFAPLHDLGKVAIPDEILLKLTELTPAERRTCEQHPLIGEQILRPLRPDARALEMVRHHHEDWDGQGYPDRLNGMDIPLLARILHVVDSYDAILSQRPYSPGLAPQEALAQIRLGRGREFDPELVEAFVELLQEEGVVAPQGLALAVAQQTDYQNKWEQ